METFVESRLAFFLVQYYLDFLFIRVKECLNNGVMKNYRADNML